MKKILFVLFASILVLSACGNEKGSETKQETKVNEDEPQFTNDTLVIDDAVLKIKDTFIVNDKDSGKKSIVFKYEVKSKSGRENVAPNTIFMAGFTVLQDTENSIAELDAGTTPNTGKYEEWSKHAYDTIKKGKSAKGIIGYELENNNKVTLKATKGIGGKELGEKEIDLSKLKTVDYSAVDDIVGEFNDSNNQNTTSSNNSASDQKNTQDQVVYKNNDASDEVVDNQKVAQPKTEELPQNGIGGHPSLYDPSIPPPSEDNLKTDENGDVYYDATNE
uniref:Terminase large subunit n=1 Tax=Staphylococcus phage Pel11 TaxID=3235046 RepID=A0AB39C7K5_9CAUD